MPQRGAPPAAPSNSPLSAPFLLPPIESSALPPACRLHYAIVVSVNLLQCAVGCATHGVLYASGAPAGGGAPRARPLALEALGNGTSWLMFYTCFSSLPYRQVGG